MFVWDYKGIMAEWDNTRFTECPSFMQTGEKCLLSASVCPIGKPHYFSIMYGSFKNGLFTIENVGQIDKGPDQYAGQIFKDPKGRCILITWIPGWSYIDYQEKDVGCMSVPREIYMKDGKIYGYPVEEVWHLLKDTDPSVQITDDGFIIQRTNREPVKHTGEVKDLKILRDGFILEVFVNYGETIYTVLL
jgi:beta-fructofuranosidase